LRDRINLHVWRFIHLRQRADGNEGERPVTTRSARCSDEGSFGEFDIGVVRS